MTENQLRWTVTHFVHIIESFNDFDYIVVSILWINKCLCFTKDFETTLLMESLNKNTNLDRFLFLRQLLITALLQSDLLENANQQFVHIVLDTWRCFYEFAVPWRRQGFPLCWPEKFYKLIIALQKSYLIYFTRH